MLCAFSAISAQTRVIDNESLSIPVGEISLVIGKAYIESENNQTLRASNGDFVREGDIILTESNGHVHLRFLDDAVLSVRPLSRLQIVSYRFDESNPESSLVKLDLIEGTQEQFQERPLKRREIGFVLTPLSPRLVSEVQISLYRQQPTR